MCCRCLHPIDASDGGVPLSDESIECMCRVYVDLAGGNHHYEAAGATDIECLVSSEGLSGPKSPSQAKKDDELGYWESLKVSSLKVWGYFFPSWY